ncbi:hypothetical protein HOE67_04240 [Candidatus Peregrinibacteria bacterium]|jgi:DNA-directed RNA polymerase subunit M/transcription elongation factor TFIIS|nr:hypothetical protein [Candidatus Peregrinibacteria bacterium]MBT4056293.1 hypothetical protein [Candidatus Peregrinibacteria bacterium]
MSESIVFYCKDCEKLVETDRIGKKYVYKCKKCGTKNVAFGTDKSIKNFFRIKEEKKEEEAPKKDAPKEETPKEEAPKPEEK